MFQLLFLAYLWGIETGMPLQHRLLGYIDF